MNTQMCYPQSTLFQDRSGSSAFEALWGTSDFPSGGEFKQSVSAGPPGGWHGHCMGRCASDPEGRGEGGPAAQKRNEDG
jgi:hypothetical protein